MTHTAKLNKVTNEESFCQALVSNQYKTLVPTPPKSCPNQVSITFKTQLTPKGLGLTLRMGVNYY